MKWREIGPTGSVFICAQFPPQENKNETKAKTKVTLGLSGYCFPTTTATTKVMLPSLFDTSAGEEYQMEGCANSVFGNVDNDEF